MLGMSDSSNVCHILTLVCGRQHLVGRIFYPCNPEALKQKRYQRACWLPSWTYARGMSCVSHLKKTTSQQVLGVLGLQERAQNGISPYHSVHACKALLA